MKTFINYLLFPVYAAIIVIVLVSVAIGWVFVASRKRHRKQVSWEDDNF